MTPLLSLALVALFTLGTTGTAFAQELLYRFQWDVTTIVNRPQMTVTPAGPSVRDVVSTTTFSGSGPLTLSVSRPLDQMAFSFNDPRTGSGGYAVLLAGMGFSQATFSTGLEGSAVPPPLVDRYLAASTYTPLGDPAAPDRFTVTLYSAFECRSNPSIPRCGGVSVWNSTLIGTATRATAGGAPIAATEPLTLALVGVGLLLAARLARAP